jgi:hypothetical protein
MALELVTILLESSSNKTGLELFVIFGQSSV